MRLPSTIFVATEPVNMRLSFDRLAGLVRERFGHEPRTDAVFVFLNERATHIKLLWHDGTGYRILFKRLDRRRGRFRIPQSMPGRARHVRGSARALSLLLEGIDMKLIRAARRANRYLQRPVGERRGGRGLLGACAEVLLESPVDGVRARLPGARAHQGHLQDREEGQAPASRRANRIPPSARGPIVEALDGWVVDASTKAEDGGRLQSALTYYTNQRAALGRFLTDGRLQADNNGSERELRALVKGRDNWQHFETPEGLKWYCVFRGLISSCKLHCINPYDYLEQMLRLSRHWPKESLLALSPKYWQSTLGRLDPRQRSIVDPPWQCALSCAPPRDGPVSEAA